MQIIVIAVLIVIAGLIGALLACATRLMNRARAANITLRRIEEALLSLNRVKAFDSAIKSAEPVQHSQPAGAGRVGFLTIRELKMMSGRDRQSADSAPIPNRRKPLRTSATTSPHTDLQCAIGCEGTLAVDSAGVATHGALVPALKTEATGQTIAAFADRDPRIEASENLNGLESSFEISCPGPDQHILNTDVRKSIGDAIVHESQIVATAVAQTMPTTNHELPIQKSSEAAEEAPVATRTALDEGLEKKRAQQALMIISSRRRRARAGR